MTAGTRQPVLSVKELTIVTKGNGRPLVQKLNLEIFPGETVCLVGESGSGKSLTSLAIMGLLDSNALRVSSGEILVASNPVLNLPPEKLRSMRGTTMSMVFQEPMTALNPVEIVGKQIEEVLEIHWAASKADRKARVVEMLDAVHLPDPKRIYSRYPHELSGGQRQRIVISMALILKPKLLIADEPTTALDVTTQKQILLLIEELKQRFGTAVLFVTHDFGVVADIADRICVMNCGEVVETGPRDQILAAPTEPYTRTLISAVPSLIPRAKRTKVGEAVLTVQGLEKTYHMGGLFKEKRAIAAVKNGNLKLRKGQIIGIVGESGSGKTTLARCVSRLTEPSSGVIELNGHDISNSSERQLKQVRKNLQVVFQDPYRSLNARMRVKDAITEGLRNYGVPKQRAYARAETLLKRVGLDAAAMERYPHQFSGGQRQRICIARALALDPAVIVADEAVSALDVSVQAQVLNLLALLRDESGVAILFITHDLRVAAQICDRIIVMKQGEIVEAGDAEDVLTRPEHSYTRELFAAAPGRDWDFANFRAFDRSKVDGPLENPGHLGL